MGAVTLSQAQPGTPIQALIPALSTLFAPGLFSGPVSYQLRAQILVLPVLSNVVLNT